MRSFLLAEISVLLLNLCLDSHFISAKSVRNAANKENELLCKTKEDYMRNSQCVHVSEFLLRNTSVSNLLK